MTTNSTALKTIEVQGLQLIPEMLQTFDLRLSKMKNYYLGLKHEIEKGLTPELDKKMHKFIVAAKTTKADFNKQRSPITRKLDAIKKEFTAKENVISNYIKTVQTSRDLYAKKVIEKQEEARREAQRKEMAANEKINITANIELEFRAFVQAQIDRLKKGIINSLKTVDDKNFKEKFEKLKKLSIEFPVSKMKEFKTSQVSKFGHDVQAIQTEIIAKLNDELFTFYKSEINIYKAETIQMFNKMAKDLANKEEILKKEKEKIEMESATAEEVAKQQVNANKEAALAESAFQSTGGEVVTEVPESRTGYKIKVLSKEAYAALVAYWFSVCAKDFTGNYERKTIGSMIKDLEKYAHSTGQKLTNTSIVYEKIYKAVNRK